MKDRSLRAALLALTLGACSRTSVEHNGRFYDVVGANAVTDTVRGLTVENGVEEYITFAGDGTFFQSHDYGQEESGRYSARGRLVCLSYRKRGSGSSDRCLSVLRRVPDGKVMLTDFRGFDYGPGFS